MIRASLSRRLAIVLAPLLLWAGGAVPPDDALGRAEALAQQGSQLELQGRYDDAIQLTSEDLAIHEKILGPDHPDLAKSLNNLAGLYFDKSRLTEAEPLYRRSIAILKKARGQDNPDVATIIENLGNLDHAQGRYKDAEDVERRALAIREKAFGPDDPKVAKSLNNLGSAVLSQGRYQRPNHSSSAASRYRKRPSGPMNKEVANTLNNLAALYEAEGRYLTRKNCIGSSLAIFEKALVRSIPTSPEPSTIWRKCSSPKPAYGEAEPLLKRSLAIREKALGADHSEVGESLKIWRKSITSRAATPRPNHCFDAAWHCKKALGQIIRRSPRASAIWRRYSPPSGAATKPSALPAQPRDPRASAGPGPSRRRQ